MDDLKGKTLGRYRLLEDIGQGGMSTVYKARDLDKKKAVAVKVLTPYVAQEPKFRERFDREIRLLKGLHHEHIVPILNYGEDEGITYIVMPYYSGGTLQDRVDDGGLGLGEIGRVMEQLTSALQYAHDKGIVHRDIKPSNILLDKDGRAMLSDFGFAYVSETSHSLTGSVLIGTPAFMSPEQCRGEDITARSDQYSLGALLYQLTTGRLPYEGDTPMSVVIKHINDPLPRPRFLNPHLPDVLEAVVMQSMAKDPEHRYESIMVMNVAFAAGLKESVDPETGLARASYIGPAPETQVIVHKERAFGALLTRNRVTAGAVLLALLAIPLTAFALTGGRSSSGVASGSETPTPSQFLLATINALSTANAEALGGSEEPGAVESAVAATVEAMGLFDEPEVLGSPLTPITPTSTPSATPASTVGGVNPPGAPPPGPPSPPGGPTNTPGSGLTSTPGSPTNTPGSPTNTPGSTTNTPGSPTNTPVPPTNTSAPPTNTPVPPPPEPTTDPDKCKPDKPLGHPLYCTPTP